MGYELELADTKTDKTARAIKELEGLMRSPYVEKDVKLAASEQIRILEEAVKRGITM